MASVGVVDVASAELFFDADDRLKSLSEAGDRF
jgi:hypothetical protein